MKTLNNFTCRRDERDNLINILELKGAINGLNLRFKRKDSSVFWAKIQANPIKNKDGKIKFVEGFIIDISADISREKTISRYTEELEAIFENNIVGIAYTEDSMLRRINHKGQKILGIGQDVDLPINFLEFQKITNKTLNLKRGIEGAQEPVGISGGASHSLYRQGRNLLMVCAKPWPKYDSANRKIIWAFYDITDQVQLEENLIKAKELAEAASKAKSSFLANMSHEIRTPLNGVLAMLQLLRYTPMTTEQKDFVDSAYTSGNSLLTVINDILDITKIEAGKMDIVKKPFSPKEMLGAVEGTFKSQAMRKGINFHCDLDSSVPKQIKGDEVRIRQILFNLVGNCHQIHTQRQRDLENHGCSSTRQKRHDTQPGGFRQRHWHSPKQLADHIRIIRTSGCVIHPQAPGDRAWP